MSPVSNPNSFLSAEQLKHTHEITISKEFASGQCTDFDHITFYVSSPKILATHMIKLFGFSLYAYKGLETGSREISATAVKNGSVIMQFVGAIRPLHDDPSKLIIDKIHRYVATHGDSVKDVAFQVENIYSAVASAREGGADVLMEPTKFDDEFGSILMAKVAGINETTHTFIDRKNYGGFLPGYSIYAESVDFEPIIDMEAIDHCVQNEDWNKMESACEFYKKAFGFHVFWSVDEKQVFTEYSALKSTVMVSGNEKIKMPINEPAVGLRKSQIEEFIEFNKGAGIQHIAIRVPNIVDAIKKMRDYGVDFIEVPDEYYQNVEEKMTHSKHPKIKEALKTIKQLGILIDYDEHGYLLQLFTRPLFERPTFFFEIIQRNNHNGFGAGNFKGLFEVLEKDQEKRGNLVNQNSDDYKTSLDSLKISTAAKEVTDDDFQSVFSKPYAK